MSERGTGGGISAVLIVRDAARTLDRCLETLRSFDEVVVYDTGSKDESPQLAQAHPNVRFFATREFPGFGPAKNRAVEFARNDWVFSLDADEFPDADLLRALSEWDKGDALRLGIVRRCNFLMGQPVRHGGWGDDQLARLFHRKRHRFSDAPVHERVLPREDSRRVLLPGELHHHTAPDLDRFFNKARDYTALSAPECRVLHPAVFFWRAVFAFFTSYILQLGFLAGWRGLVIAWSRANGVFFKYLRAWVQSRGA